MAGPYKDIFDTYDPLKDHEEEMARKYGYKFDYLKQFYPQAAQLPETEIESMIDVINQKGDTLDEAIPHLKAYINQNEASWKKNQFSPESESPQNWLDNNFEQNLRQEDYGENPYKNTSLDFDGQYLKLMRDGKIHKTWPGISGSTKRQRKAFQWMPGEGPLPEGKYHVRQSNMQNFDDLPLKDRVFAQMSMAPKYAKVSLGKWPGGTASWGRHRVWLEPDENTNTFNRDNFSIHGGWKRGSGGCIDLTGQMDDFARDYRNSGQDMDLNVYYPNYTW